MIALKIHNSNAFMATLLKGKAFYDFDLIEVDIVTYNSFHIDGFNQKDFFGDDKNKEHSEENAPEEFSAWSKIQPICLDLIKGQRSPLSFKIILRLNQKAIISFLKQKDFVDFIHELPGLYINVRFENQNLTCMSGTSFKNFTLDKSLEKAWDNGLMDLLQELHIDFDEL